MAKIGYARCSSQGQDLTIQQDRLRKAGCTIIRSEKVSGGSRNSRDELTSIMEFVREGDELVVLKLDRLGRNTRDVLNLVHELRQKGAILSVLEPRFSTTDVAGPILVTVLGMAAELERSFIRERQKAGIERAKANGVYKGRKPTVPVEQVRAMHKDGVGPSAIARELGISRMSVHSGATRSRVTPVDKMALVGYSAALTPNVVALVLESVASERLRPDLAKVERAQGRRRHATGATVAGQRADEAVRTRAANLR